MSARFEAALAEAARVLEVFRADAFSLEACDEFCEAIASCLRAGGKVMVAGNGGSMADALHFAEEWTGRFRSDRVPLPVMALGDPTHLTCVGNDYGFDQVFARLVRAFSKSGDLLVLLSTSGESMNLVLAAEAAHSLGIQVIGLLGRGGGKLRPLCDVAVVAPGETADRIQEVHMLILHAVIESVEEALGLA